MGADFTSRQTLEDGVYKEHCRVGGRDLVRDVPIPTTHVRWSRKGAMRAYVIVTGLLRLLVRLLYVFPIFVVAKLVLFILHVQMGDLIVVAFVELVVAIFALLAVTVLLMLVVGPRSERTKHSSLVHWLPTPSQAKRLLSRAGTTRVTGRVEAGLDAGATVLSEAWSLATEPFERRVSGSSFLVIPDEGTPLAVELLGCPLLLDLHAVRQGERVEIVATEARPVIHLDDPRLDEIVRNAGPGLAPYRETESTTLVVTSTPESPVIIRRA